MIEIPSIQWFPGHMAKTRRLMKESLRLVDIVVELTDARIPRSSRNPEIDRLVGSKPRLVLLNKCDMADDRVTQQWCDDYRKQKLFALPADCKSGKGLKGFFPAVQTVLKEEIARWEAKGMSGRPIRMMIVGVPNVGKSSLINRLSKSKRAKVEDRPGITRGRQWVSLDSGVELLDMPGVLWPKFEDPIVGEHLAFTGAVKDDVVDLEWLAVRLLAQIQRDYPQLLAQRFRLEEEEAQGLDGYELLELVGRKRGMLISGGNVHTERASIMVLDEFRGGKIGKISLETPYDKPEEAKFHKLSDED